MQSANLSRGSYYSLGGARGLDRRLRRARDGGACRFCGDPLPVMPESFHLDGDHADWSPDNLTTACLLCHACQHLGREAIAQEAAPI